MKEGLYNAEDKRHLEAIEMVNVGFSLEPIRTLPARVQCILYSFQQPISKEKFDIKKNAWLE